VPLGDLKAITFLSSRALLQRTDGESDWATAQEPMVDEVTLESTTKCNRSGD
jgi:hypothetical protein